MIIKRTRRNRSNGRTTFGSLAVAITLATGAVGCGGSGSSSSSVPATGSATFSIAWPVKPAVRSNVKPQVIPSAANSVDITLTDANGKVTDSGPIVKPTGAWTSPELPPGNYVIGAKAYPGTSAGSLGVAQAVGAGSVTIIAGQNTAASLTMGSTVAALAMSPPSPSVNLGSAATVSVSATDSSGAIVVIAPGTVSWTSSDPTAVSIAGNGLSATVTGLLAGAVTIGATFNEVEPSLGQSPIKTSANFSVLAGTTTVTVSARPKTR